MSKVRMEREDSFTKRIPTKLRNMFSKLWPADEDPSKLESRTVHTTTPSSDYFLSPQQKSKVNNSPNKKNSAVQQSGLSVLQSAPSSSVSTVVRHGKRNSHSVIPITESSSTVASNGTSLDNLIRSVNQPKHSNNALHNSSTFSSSTAMHRSLSGGGSLQTATITPSTTASTTGQAKKSSGQTSTVDTSTSTIATTAVTNTPTVLCCDKCDGKHETANCPYYKKKRDDHPDAQKNKQIGGTSPLPGSVLRNARVVRQPGDGSCLFHSMSYGLKSGASATTLRSEICRFIQSNPHLKISDTPLQDWVKWDSGGASVTDYARTMSRGSWGGGIEMACMSQLKGCNVHVYERYGTGFKRISAFDHPVAPETKPVIRVLYGGGVHYDALVC